MKQRLTAIVTLLLLGALTTLVVAWAPAVDVCRRQALMRTATEWHSPEAAAIITAELTQSVRQYPGWMNILEPSVDLGPGMQQIRVLQAHGWPLPSMLSVQVQATEDDGRQWSRSIHTLRIAGQELPARPIWSGFALDTLFFAVVWTAAASFLAVVRRGRKSVQGRHAPERSPLASAAR